jgi:uncharacterized protein
MRVRITIAICMLGLFVGGASAQSPSSQNQSTPKRAAQTGAETPATREDVIKMLDALHTKETMKTVMQVAAVQAKAATRKSIKEAHPEATEHDLAEGDRLMDQVFNELPLDEIIESMIPIYQKHFTGQDLGAISAFYASPTGQKMVREMPAMMQESMQASMALVEKKMMASQKKVEEMMNDIIEKNQKSRERRPTTKS